MPTNGKFFPKNKLLPCGRAPPNFLLLAASSDQLPRRAEPRTELCPSPRAAGRPAVAGRLRLFMLTVTIDPGSGYCFGVEYAIQMAEDELARPGAGPLYCLGDIVHNRMEVERLHQLGLQVIDRADLPALHDCRVLIRAHGEPPETYALALANRIELVDASCPVVLKLQNRVKHAWDDTAPANGQLVLYGQPGHAEVVGITGQTGDQAIVITTEADLDRLDYGRPITLFSQTTKSTAGFYRMKELMEERIRAAGHDPADPATFDANDSICRQVSNREPALRRFAAQHDVIVFVSGRKSSNGKALFGVVQETNARAYFVENEAELDPEWFVGTATVGVCGATSTPLWLMRRVADHVEQLPALA